MKKIIKILLNKIISCQQQIKRYRLALIFKHKKHKGNQNEKDTFNFNTSVCLCGIGSKDVEDNDNSDGIKKKKSYIRDLKDGNESKRKDIYNWIAASEPTHFLSIQFPMNMRSPSLDVSKNNLRRLMARFEQCLIGSRWTKSHLTFYAFAEKGRHDGYSYHFHILLNAGTYTTDELQKALDAACVQLALSPDICYLEETEIYEVIYYCLKGVDISNKSGCYDGIILSADLFNI